MNITEFDKIVAEILGRAWLEDNPERRNVAAGVLDELRGRVFGEELKKEERRQAYIKLKAEFEPEGKKV